jgi:hypothetical protein
MDTQGYHADPVNCYSCPKERILWKPALDPSTPINQIQERLVTEPSFTDIQKSLISIELANAEKCLYDGADEQLQLQSLFCIKV